MVPFPWLIAIAGAIVAIGFASLLFHHTSRNFVRDNAEGIKIVLLVLAATYTAWVYDREATDNRIANTLAFKERAEKGSLRASFNRVDMLWIRSDATWELHWYRLRRANTADKTELRRLDDKFLKFSGKFVEANYLQDEIFAIHRFYKDINICVKQGRCHEPTACELFAEDMQNFRRVYVRFLHKWDKLWQTDVLDSLRGFCARCTDHLPPGKGNCSRPREATNLFERMGFYP